MLKDEEAVYTWELSKFSLPTLSFSSFFFFFEKCFSLWKTCFHLKIILESEENSFSFSSWTSPSGWQESSVLALHFPCPPPERGSSSCSGETSQRVGHILAISPKWHKSSGRNKSSDKIAFGKSGGQAVSFLRVPEVILLTWQMSLRHLRNCVFYSEAFLFFLKVTYRVRKKRSKACISGSGATCSFFGLRNPEYFLNNRNVLIPFLCFLCPSSERPVINHKLKFPIKMKSVDRCFRALFSHTCFWHPPVKQQFSFSDICYVFQSLLSIWQK